MELIEQISSCLCFSFLLLIFQTTSINSIQCCRGDSSCSSEPIDCPSNVCFKLVINKVNEERGCMNDLITLVDFPSTDGRNLNDESIALMSASNDQCRKSGSPGNAMSLCKCTTNLCNSTMKSSSLTYSLAISLLLSLSFLILS